VAQPEQSQDSGGLGRDDRRACQSPRLCPYTISVFSDISIRRTIDTSYSTLLQGFSEGLFSKLEAERPLIIYPYPDQASVAKRPHVVRN
jgi:hypothetical protein